MPRLPKLLDIVAVLVFLVAFLILSSYEYALIVLVRSHTAVHISCLLYSSLYFHISFTVSSQASRCYLRNIRDTLLTPILQTLTQSDIICLGLHVQLWSLSWSHT